jgi:predicted DNA-binding transcriptional regulator AlpA
MSKKLSTSDQPVTPALQYISENSSPISINLPTTGYIRQAQLIPAIIPFSSATLWRKVKAGTFPAPVKLSERVTAWPVESIREWMLSRTK